ncbi:MAG: hypothetical protein KAV87_12335 [Desulfobacteraceae bacterium]|nr:hypothetical protein [Desulfobacteraceae bacterium]
MMNEKQLQKAVEDVRKKGFLDVTIRIDAKKFAGINDKHKMAKNLSHEFVEELIFNEAFKILEAYKKKYGKK